LATIRVTEKLNTLARELYEKLKVANKQTIEIGNVTYDSQSQQKT